MPSALRSPIRPAVRSPVRSGLTSAPTLNSFLQAAFSGYDGGAWLFSNTQYLFQDSAGATPVTAVAQPIGRVTDISGKSHPLTQSSSTKRPVFSRRYNYVLNAEVFSSGWTTVNTTVTGNTTTAPDGTVTADTLTANAGTATKSIYQAVTSLSKKFTWSVYAKANSATFMQLLTSANGQANFDLANGTTQATIATSSITSVGDGWYLCRIAFDDSVTEPGNVHINIVTSLSAARYESNSLTTSIYIWGADYRLQQEQLNIPTYQSITTASVYTETGFPGFATFDGTDDVLSCTVGNIGSACTMVVADSTGLWYQEGMRYDQSGSVFDCPVSASLKFAMLINRTLTANELAQLAAWLGYASATQARLILYTNTQSNPTLGLQTTGGANWNAYWNGGSLLSQVGNVDTERTLTQTNMLGLVCITSTAAVTRLTSTTNKWRSTLEQLPNGLTYATITTGNLLSGSVTSLPADAAYFACTSASNTIGCNGTTWYRTSMDTFRLGNSKSQATVDAVFVAQAATITSSTGGALLDLQETSNAAPSAASSAARTYLAGLGFTVQTN